MKRILALLFALCLLLLAGCGQQTDATYRQISQEEAKEMMDAGDAVVLDVREQSEYDEGHIPGAVLLPGGLHRRGHRRRRHSRKERHGAGLLPQRQPKQDRCRRAGGTGLHRRLRVWGHQHLAL